MDELLYSKCRPDIHIYNMMVGNSFVVTVVFVIVDSGAGGAAIDSAFVYGALNALDFGCVCIVVVVVSCIEVLAVAAVVEADVVVAVVNVVVFVVVLSHLFVYCKDCLGRSCLVRLVLTYCYRPTPDTRMCCQVNTEGHNVTL